MYSEWCWLTKSLGGSMPSSWRIPPSPAHRWLYAARGRGESLSFPKSKMTATLRRTNVNFLQWKRLNVDTISTKCSLVGHFRNWLCVGLATSQHRILMTQAEGYIIIGLNDGFWPTWSQTTYWPNQLNQSADSLLQPKINFTESWRHKQIKHRLPESS